MDNYATETHETKLCLDGIVPFDNYLDSMRTSYIDTESFIRLWKFRISSPEHMGVANFKVHSLHNYLTKFSFNCFPVTGRISFLLNDGTHIGFSVPMYKATFLPLIEEGLNLTFTESDALLKKR